MNPFIEYLINCWRGVKRVYKETTEDNFDQETKEIMDKYQDEYLQHGWEMVSSFQRVLCPSMFIFILLFIGSDNPYYWRGIYSYPIWFIFVILIDKFYCSNKKLAEIFLMLYIIAMGLAIIVGNLKKKTYYFNEHWTSYILITQY